MNARPLATLICAAAAAPALAQTYTERLVAGSTYRREECLGPCACVYQGPPPAPLTGQLTLTFDHSDTWTSYYTVTATFHTGTPLDPDLTLEGTGEYHIGGDFALTHRLTLDLSPAGGQPQQVFHFDSGERVVTGGEGFPAISISATTGVVGCSRRTLGINAAPIGRCAADIGGQGGDPGSDGALDNNDFIVFIDAFFNSAPVADMGGQGGTPGADGHFDNNDFVAFIDAFFNATGC